MGGSRGGQKYGGPGCGARMRFRVAPYTRMVVRDLAGREHELPFFSALRMEDAIRRLRAGGYAVLTINGEPPYDPDELAAALQTLHDNGCRTERGRYPFVYVSLVSEGWGIATTIANILADPMGIANRLKAEKRQKLDVEHGKESPDWAR